MRPSRLSDILSTFSNTEWKGVHRYILAMTKEGGDVRRVWDSICSSKTELSTLLSEPKIFNKRFDTAYSYSYFKKINTLLLNYVDEYLIIQDIRRNKVHFEVDKIRIYQSRKLFYHSDFLYKKLTRELSNSDFHELSKAKTSMTLMHNRFYSEHPKRYEEAPVLLLEMHHTLIQYASQIGALIKLEMYNRSSLLKEVYDKEISDFDAIISIQEDNELVLLFTQIYNILATGELSEFSNILEMLQQEPGILEPQIEKAILVLLSNFLSLEIKKGKHLDKVKSLLSLSKLGIDRGSFLNDGMLPLPRMLNIIEFACVNNEIDWAVSFSRANIHLVSSANKKIIKPLIQANLFFYKKNYEGAFALLKELKLKSPGEQVRRTELLIICVYELYGEIDADFVNTFLKNYSQWLDSHIKELHDADFQGAKNHIKFVRILLKSPDYNVIKEFLSSTAFLRKRSWAKQKLIDFKK